MKYCVTAALPYANGDIHLGHLVEYFQADFWVRFQKMKNKDEVLFFCADDTHGTPIMLSAIKQGLPVETLLERSFTQHTKDFQDFQIEFDHYSSTHTETNEELCASFYKAMKVNDCILTKTVKQAYCNQDQMFLPDRFVKGSCPKCDAKNQYGDSCDVCGSTYSPLDMKDAVSSVSGLPVVEKESKHLFFRLQKYQEFLKDWTKTHTSKEIYNKLYEWLHQDLQDWNISRDAPYFGFPIPGEKDKYFYVWIDAPIGYIATTKEWCVKNQRDYKEFWIDEDIKMVHFIGKDIIYFHTLFWPALLKMAGYRLPSQIFVHGFLTINNEKMSKSKGTFITARSYLKVLSPLYLRYYYASKLGPSFDDIDFNVNDFATKINTELIGKIVNLCSRTVQLLIKNFSGSLLASLNQNVINMIHTFVEKSKNVILNCYEEREFSKVTAHVRAMADEANLYFDQQSPWQLVKTDKMQAHEVLTISINYFRILIIFLQPILPSMGQQVSSFFHEVEYTWESLDSVLYAITLDDYKYLLQRLDADVIQSILANSQS